MPSCLGHAPDYFTLAVGMSRASVAQVLAQAPAPEPYSAGDRVTERGRPDLVLTVKSCVKGYVSAERWEKHPDRMMENGFVLHGPLVFAYGSNAPAEYFELFARAGDERPEPAPKPPRQLSAVELLELSTDGGISAERYDAARRVDAERDLGAEWARSFAQMAAE